MTRGFFLVGLLSVVSSPAVGQDLENLGKQWERTLAKIRPAVVDIVIQEEFRSDGDEVTAVPKRKRLFRCSGVIRSRKGEVVTLLRGGLPPAPNGGKLRIEITLHDGEVRTAEHKVTDLATGVTLLQIVDPPRLKTAKVAKRSTLKPGSLVIAVGSSNGVRHATRRGIVSSVERELRHMTFYFPRAIETDITAEPGVVGGMLANSAGQMEGLLAFTFARAQGQNPKKRIAGPVHAIELPRAIFQKHAISQNVGAGGSPGSVLAIPIDLLERICTELSRRGKVTRGEVGASFIFRGNFSAVAEKVDAQLRMAAIQAQKIDPNGNAARAGLQPGDLVLRIANREIRSRRDLAWFAELVEYGKIGAKLDLRILRPSTQTYRTLSLRVGQRQDD